jgi:long-chain acyl-CoA synthetase
LSVLQTNPRHGPRTAKELWIGAVEKYGPREYVAYFPNGTKKPAYRITFAEAGKQVNIIANMLQREFAIKKGDHVAIAMRNYPEYLLFFWAILSIGAVVSNINAWLTAPEMEYCITDSKSKLIIADGERAKALTSVFDKLGCPIVVLRAPNSFKSSGKVFNYDELMKKYAQHTTLPHENVHYEDDATIFYTSGTTGKPKGALGSNLSIVGGAMSVRFGSALGIIRMGYDETYLPKYSLDEPQQTALVPTPLFHVTAMTATHVPYTFSGSKSCLMYKWDPIAAMEIIQQEKVFGMASVPYMILSILEHPGTFIWLD